MGDSVISPGWRQLCAPVRAHWHHLANTIELVLPSAHPSTQPNDKSIGSTIFAQLTAKCRQACPAMSFPLIIALFMGIWTPCNNASLGPQGSITQMASQSV